MVAYKKYSRLQFGGQVVQFEKCCQSNTFDKNSFTEPFQILYCKIQWDRYLL